MDEITKTKAGYAMKIEDARKVEVFTSMPEWQWYVEHVLQSTIYERTQRIMRGSNDSDKKDWIDRGVVQGLQMVVDGAEGLKRLGQQAKEDAKKLQEAIDNES